MACALEICCGDDRSGGTRPRVGGHLLSCQADALLEDEDRFAAMASVASRLFALAADGQILVSKELLEASRLEGGEGLPSSGRHRRMSAELSLDRSQETEKISPVDMEATLRLY